MDRRKFIKNISTTTLSGILFSRASFGGVRDFNPHQLLVIRVNGGMESLMGLNPWVGDRPGNEDLFIDKSYNILRNVKGTEVNLGPSALSLAEHAKDFSIINGIFMGASDVGHESAMQYLSRGDSNGQNDFLASIAYNLGKKDSRVSNSILVNRSVDAQSYNRYLDVQNFSTFFKNEEDDNKINGFSVNRRSAFSSALNEVFLGQSKNLSEGFQGLYNSISQEYEESLNEEDIQLLSSLILRDIDFAQIDISPENESLDTHDNHEDSHSKAQKQIWDKISTYFKVLKNQGNGFQNLTVVVLNDFSRLPFLNSALGKDHNFFENSVLVAGANIKGGLVIGESNLFKKSSTRENSQRSGLPYDYKAARSISLKDGVNVENYAKDLFGNKSIDMIRPYNIWATIASSLSLNPKNIKDLPSDAKVLSRLIK